MSNELTNSNAFLLKKMVFMGSNVDKSFIFDRVTNKHYFETNYDLVEKKLSWAQVYSNVFPQQSNWLKAVLNPISLELYSQDLINTTFSADKFDRVLNKSPFVTRTFLNNSVDNNTNLDLLKNYFNLKNASQSDYIIYNPLINPYFKNIESVLNSYYLNRS
jgi:hypothetical protein